MRPVPHQVLYRCGLYPTAAGYTPYCPVCSALEQVDDDFDYFERYQSETANRRTWSAGMDSWSDGIDAVLHQAYRARQARRKYGARHHHR